MDLHCDCRNITYPVASTHTVNHSERWMLMDSKLEHVFLSDTEDTRSQVLKELWIRLLNETEHVKRMQEKCFPYSGET